MRKPDLAQLATQTQHVYERNARKFADQRPNSLIEKPWLDRFRALMPAQGDILDLGCGTGEPIAAYLMQQGHHVIGLDAAPTMIRLARKALPAGDWRLGDMRRLHMPQRFGGILGWNSFFHLTGNEQRDLLPKIARHLLPGGALLLTVGPDEGEVAGFVAKDPVYHASLSQEEYRAILAREGLEIMRFTPRDSKCYDMTLLLAQHTGV